MNFSPHEKYISKKRSHSPIMQAHSPRNVNAAHQTANLSIHNIPHLKQYAGSNRPIMNT